MKDCEAKHEKYQREMIERSLIHTGNNFRIKNVMKKAKNGEEVVAVYLGGSITEENYKKNKIGFASYSFQYFKDNFGVGENIHYVNAGLNGTSSILGLIRAERDVISYRPDLVFVEFAVNDSKDSMHREAFESLIVKLLQADKKPAIVLLFMISEAGYSCQGHMQAVGEYYNLPMISVGEAIQPEIEAKRLLWSEYSDDNIHPNGNGHKLITECIQYYFETVNLEQIDDELEVLQESFYGSDFQNIHMLDSSNIRLETMGSFEAKKTLQEFPNGWEYVQNSGNKKFIVKLNCKNFHVIYQVNNDMSMGNAEIYVDGILTGVLSGFSIFGWNNSVHKLIFQEECVMEHTIEIMMTSGDEQKTFILLGFGYSGMNEE